MAIDCQSVRVLSMKIDFEMAYEGAVFRDAIVLPDNHGLDDGQIEQIKQNRFAQWIAAVQSAEEE